MDSWEVSQLIPFLRYAFSFRFPHHYNYEPHVNHAKTVNHYDRQRNHNPYLNINFESVYLATVHRHNIRDPSVSHIVDDPDALSCYLVHVALSNGPYELVGRSGIASKGYMEMRERPWQTLESELHAEEAIYPDPDTTTAHYSTPYFYSKRSSSPPINLAVHSQNVPQDYLQQRQAAVYEAPSQATPISAIPAVPNIRNPLDPSIKSMSLQYRPPHISGPAGSPATPTPSRYAVNTVQHWPKPQHVNQKHVNYTHQLTPQMRNAAATCHRSPHHPQYRASAAQMISPTYRRPQPQQPQSLPQANILQTETRLYQQSKPHLSPREAHERFTQFLTTQHAAITIPQQRSQQQALEQAIQFSAQRAKLGSQQQPQQTTGEHSTPFLAAQYTSVQTAPTLQQQSQQPSYAHPVPTPRYEQAQQGPTIHHGYSSISVTFPTVSRSPPATTLQVVGRAKPQTVAQFLPTVHLDDPF